MLVRWRERLPSARGLLLRVEHLARELVRRSPRRVQTLVTVSVDRLARRWPVLARLVGLPSPLVHDPPPIEAETAVDGQWPGSDRAGGQSAESHARRNGDGMTPRRDLRRDLLECLRASNDASARGAAARALAGVVDRETTFALVIALRDPMAEVAMEAADALRHHPIELGAPALRHVIDNRDKYFSSATRAAAVRTLGALLPPGQADLVAAAVADVDATVSLAAVTALAERDEEAGADALLCLLEDRSGFYVPLTRQAAARGLSQMASTDAGRIDALLGYESDATVREALVSARSRAP